MVKSLYLYLLLVKIKKQEKDNRMLWTETGNEQKNPSCYTKKKNLEEVLEFLIILEVRKIWFFCYDIWLKFDVKILIFIKLVNF